MPWSVASSYEHKDAWISLQFVSLKDPSQELAIREILYDESIQLFVEHNFQDCRVLRIFKLEIATDGTNRRATAPSSFRCYLPQYFRHIETICLESIGLLCLQFMKSPFDMAVTASEDLQLLFDLFKVTLLFCILCHQTRPSFKICFLLSFLFVLLFCQTLNFLFKLPLLRLSAGFKLRIFCSYELFIFCDLLSGCFELGVRITRICLYRNIGICSVNGYKKWILT